MVDTPKPADTQKPLEGMIQAYHIHTREGMHIGRSGQTGGVCDIVKPEDTRTFIPFKVADWIYIPDYDSCGNHKQDLVIGVQRWNILPFGLGAKIVGAHEYRYGDKSLSLTWEAHKIVARDKDKDPRYNESQPFNITPQEAKYIEDRVGSLIYYGTFYCLLPRAFGLGFPNKPSTDELRERLAYLRRHL